MSSLQKATICVRFRPVGGTCQLGFGQISVLCLISFGFHRETQIRLVKDYTLQSYKFGVPRAPFSPVSMCLWFSGGVLYSLFSALNSQTYDAYQMWHDFCHHCIVLLCNMKAITTMLRVRFQHLDTVSVMWYTCRYNRDLPWIVVRRRGRTSLLKFSRPVGYRNRKPRYQ